MLLGNQTIENYINKYVIYFELSCYIKKDLTNFLRNHFISSFDFIRLDNEHGFGWGKSLRKQCMAI